MYCPFCGKKIKELKWEIDIRRREACAEYECICGKYIRFIDTKCTDIYATLIID
jgi:hypothetical protein